MVKTIQKVLLSGLMGMGLCCFLTTSICADDLPGASGTIAIGDKTKSSTKIHIENKTGLRILAMRLINAETTEASLNFIRKGFEVNGQADMYYNFDDEVTYSLQLTIKGQYYYIHHFPADDAASIQIHKGKGYVYLIYTSLETGETVNTKLKEKNYKGKDTFKANKKKVDTSEDKTQIYTTEDSAIEDKPAEVHSETTTSDTSDTTNTAPGYTTDSTTDPYNGNTTDTNNSTTDPTNGSDNGSTYVIPGTDPSSDNPTNGSGTTNDTGGSSTNNNSGGSGTTTPSIVETPTDNTTVPTTPSTNASGSTTK